jgi:WD40 repeat protein
MKTKIFLFFLLLITHYSLLIENCFSQSLDSLLLESVKANDFPQVQELIDKGANVNYADENGANILMWAVYSSHLEMVKYLVEKGADYKKKGVIYISSDSSSYYGNLLGTAVGNGKINIFKYFVEECKIDINDKEYNPKTKRDDNWSAIFYSIYNSDNQTLIYILDNGGDVNITDSDLNTPLIFSVQKYDLSFIKILYLYGADLNKKNKYNKAILDVAKEKNHTGIIDFLKNPIIDEFEMAELGTERILINKIKGDKKVLSTTNSEGKTLLHFSVINNRIELFDLLINEEIDVNIQDTGSYTALYYALANNKNDFAVKLIEKGAGLNIKYKNDETILLKAISINNNFLTNYLIQKGAGLSDIMNWRNEKGEYLIHKAVYNGNDTLILCLLNSGADINAQDNEGWTPLLDAIFLGNNEIAKLLINKGANVNLCNFENHSAFYLSKQRGSDEISELLIGNGAIQNISPRVKPKLTVQMGHTSSISSVSYSPDGKYALSGSRDETLKLWDINTGKEIRTFSGHSWMVTSVSFSPDGKYALSGSGDKTLKLWDINTGKEIRTFSGHSWVNSVCFSPDGKYALSGSDDKTLKLWDINTGKEIRTFSGHSSRVYSVSFSPDGKYALSGSSDRTIKLWDINTGKEIRTFSGHSWVNSVCFSPDGKYALSGSDDKTLKLWDINTGKEIRSFSGHSSGVNSVCFSPDGKYALSGSSDRTIKLWDINTGKEIRTFSGHRNGVFSVCISPDGKYALSGSDDKTLKLWDISTGKEIRTFSGHSSGVESVSFSPDGKYALSGSNDNTLKLWDINTGKEILTFSGHSRDVTSVSFSPDGKYALSGSEDTTLKLWDINTGKEIRTFSGHSWVNSVSFSPDGKYALSGSNDNTLKLWDINTGKEIRTFSGHSYIVTSVSFSSDSNYALSGSDDNTLKLWDINTGKEIRTFSGHSRNVSSVCISPDGKYALSGSWDKTLKLWDINTGKEIRTFSGHSKWVESVCFSRDGKYALSGSGDKTIKLWDINTGKEIRTFSGHSNYVNSVCFSPDGKYVLSGSGDNTMKIWNIETGKEIATLIDFTATEKGPKNPNSINYISDWAVVTPDGLFDASESGMKLMHFVVNTDDGPEAIDLEQLKNNFYVPELLPKLLGYKPGNPNDYQNRGDFNNLKLHPDMKILNYDTLNYKLNVKLRNRGGGIGRISVFVNNKELIQDARTPDIDPVNTQEFTLPIDMSKYSEFIMPGRENLIQVFAYNTDSLVSLRSRGGDLVFAEPGDSTASNPSLYAVIVGTSDYYGTKKDLSYPDIDAEAFASAVNMGAKNILIDSNNIHIKLLTTKSSGNNYPSKENIIQALDSLKKAKYYDIIIVYFAGHGDTYLNDFFYHTYETRNEFLSDAVKYPDYRKKVTISGNEILDYLKIPAQKIVLILDACGAGAVGNIPFGIASRNQWDNAKVLEFMKDRGGLFILSGASSGKESYENNSVEHGFLTYNLLLGFQTLARDVPKKPEYKGCIDVYDLFKYASNGTETLAERYNTKQSPVIRVPYSANSFFIGRINENEINKIQVKSKPPMIPSVFLFGSKKDYLGLTAKVNELLNQKQNNFNFSYYGKSDIADAYNITGSYKVENENINIEYTFSKGETELKTFIINGKTTGLDNLANEIANSVLNYIK